MSYRGPELRNTAQVTFVRVYGNREGLGAIGRRVFIKQYDSEACDAARV